MREALEYVHQHAGYTRVHNNETGKKTSRGCRVCGRGLPARDLPGGDPHLHTHVIVPNKQPRADGKLAALDSDQLWHEAKPGGVIYQATTRRVLTQSVGAEWGRSIRTPAWLS